MYVTAAEQIYQIEISDQCPRSFLLSKIITYLNYHFIYIYIWHSNLLYPYLSIYLWSEFSVRVVPMSNISLQVLMQHADDIQKRTLFILDRSVYISINCKLFFPEV